MKLNKTIQKPKKYFIRKRFYQVAIPNNANCKRMLKQSKIREQTPTLKKTTAGNILQKETVFTDVVEIK